ncbi:cadherin domain-containing protein [Marinicrinis sediminis]|uniref:Cadherin domain-containing protein n=1 Tax=Marinicrinis sediminis TaxID=1652465 RepID=A0ABW5R8A6_9BACL
MYYVNLSNGSIGRNSAYDSTPPAPAAPATPTGLTVSSATETTVDLTWSNQTDDNGGYKIYRSTTSGGSFTEAGSTNADVANYQDTGLTGGTTYYYQISAVHNAAESSPTNEVSATTTVPDTTPVVAIGTDGITEPAGGQDDGIINKVESESNFTVDAKFTDATSDTGTIYLVPSGSYATEANLQAVDIAAVSAPLNNTDYDLTVTANSLTDHTQYDLYAVDADGDVSSPVKVFDTDFSITITSSGTGDLVADISIVEETTTMDPTYGDDNGKIVVSSGQLTSTDGEAFKVERFFDYLPDGEIDPTTIEHTYSNRNPYVYGNGQYGASYNGDLLTGLDSDGTGSTGGYIFTNENYHAYIRFVDQAGNPTVWYFVNQDEKNSAPTNVMLDSQHIDEGTGTNVKVGTLSTTDDDQGDTHTYTLVSGEGDTDNSLFDIANTNELVVKNRSSLTAGQTYSVRIQTNDGKAEFAKSFTISVNDVQLPPAYESDLSDGSHTVSIDETVNAGVLIYDVDANDGDGGNTDTNVTYAITDGNTDVDGDSTLPFAIDPNTGVVTVQDAGDLDAESGTTSFSLTIQANDGEATHNLSTAALTVNLNDISPQVTANQSFSVAESETNGATIGTVAATGDDDSVTFTIQSGNTGSAFAIEATTGVLSVANTSAIDYEASTSFALTVRVSDGTNHADETVSVNVTNDNEAPSDIALSVSRVNENESSGTLVGTLSATDEDSGDTFTFSLVSGSGHTDNASFVIEGTTLKTGASFDYETQDTYSIRVRVTDRQGAFFEEAFTIAIQDVNETPTGVSLTTSSVDENVASATIIGTLTATDEDAGETFTYLFANGTGDTDNTSFTIDGSTLKTNAVFDHEVKDSYSIRVRATDSANNLYEEALTIRIQDVNETPTDITLSSTEVRENLSVGAIVGALNTEDPDQGDTFTYTLSAGGDHFSIEGSNLLTKAILNYEAKSSYDIEINVTDSGGATYTKSFTIQVIDMNEVPPKPADNEVEVLVNGKVEKAGTATTEEVKGQKVTRVVVDEAKLQKRLEEEGMGATITVPFNPDSDVAVSELNGQMIKNMEQKQAVVEIRKGNASYTLPAQQINIDVVSERFGTNLVLQDIKIKIEVAESQEDTKRLVEHAASRGGFTVVAPPLDFKVQAVYGNKTEEVTKFNAYIERTVTIPEGMDPDKITTGIVVEPDGTVRHVPTKVIQTDGQYVAQINSLTNSTYSVVWHPVAFKDVEQHWAREAVNDMGSRMVISGIGQGEFQPDRNITRAEFSAIIVRGLGLKLESGTVPFADVEPAVWYHDAIHTAYANDLISGFEDGTFRPNESITREQAMVIMAKAMKLTALTSKLSSQSAEVVLQPFEDAANASSWAAESAAASVQAGIVSGRNQNQLAPKAFVTRAEVAMMMQRLLQKSDLI